MQTARPGRKQVALRLGESYVIDTYSGIRRFAWRASGLLRRVELLGLGKCLLRQKANSRRSAKQQEKQTIGMMIPEWKIREKGSRYD